MINFLFLLWVFGWQIIISGCAESENSEPIQFKFLKSVPVAVKDTIFIDNTTKQITIDLQSNGKYKSQQPAWMKKAETPFAGETIVVKYLVDDYAVEGFRDGTITLTTLDGGSPVSLTVRQKGKESGSESDGNLLFADEFEGTTFDNTKWGYEPKAGSAWNYYVVGDNERVQVKDGNLYLRATWDAATNTPKTGAISTLNKFSFKYGEIQVKAKFVRTGQGGWPAIWMMPQTPLFSGWSNCGELDIMERLNKDHFIYNTIHLNEAYKPVPNYATPQIDPTEYNIYGLKKYAGKVEFYVNGQKTYTATKKAGQPELAWPFDTDFYIILNQACADQGVSGMNFWPGLVTNPADLPFEMAVDWVRVYEIK